MLLSGPKNSEVGTMAFVALVAPVTHGPVAPLVLLAPLAPPVLTALKARK